MSFKKKIIIKLSLGTYVKELMDHIEKEYIVLQKKTKTGDDCEQWEIIKRS